MTEEKEKENNRMNKKWGRATKLKCLSVMQLKDSVLIKFKHKEEDMSY